MYNLTILDVLHEILPSFIFILPAREKIFKWYFENILEMIVNFVDLDFL